jgi:predicted ATPase
LLEELRALARAFSDDAAVREQLTRGLFNTRIDAKAEDDLARLEELRALARAFPDDAAVREELARGPKVRNGDLAEGISLLRDGIAAYRATGVQMYLPYYTSLLASACEIAGQTEETVTLLDDALQLVEKTEELWFVAELNRHKGQLLLWLGHTDAAEEQYRRALSIAEEQEARLWELRAAVSFARLRYDQGRRAEARELLAPVYAWFTEGFGTPDLKEAKALLKAFDA